MNLRNTIVAFALAASALCGQNDPRVHRLARHLPGFVAERMTRANLPGVCVVLVSDHGVVYERGFGRKNLSFPDSITPRSVFRVASLTKQFTSMALLMLEEEGKLDLDDPVVKHVPFFKTRDGMHGKVTIRHLLAHHSGLPRGPYYAARHPSSRQQVEDLASMDLAYPPGSTYKYSNTGYNLAGNVIECVTGTSYRQFVSERILAPLGMAQSGFELHTDLASDYATGYQTDHYRPWVVPGQPLRAAPLYPAPDAAGNLFASARDVARLLLCLLCRGTLGDVTLISPESFDRMIKPFKPGADPEVGYGLGLSSGKRFNRRVFSHTGGYYGHSSLMLGFPDDNLGCIVLINRASAHTESYRILDFALAQWFGQRIPPAGADPKLAGTYTDGVATVEVVARDGALYLFEDGTAHEMHALSATRFLVPGGRFERWPVDFVGNRVLRAGPWELRRDTPPPARPPSTLDRYCGTYRDDDFGEVIVFRRGNELIFSFSRMEQVVLRPTGGARFTISAGSFKGEPAEFLIEQGRVAGLRAGYMTYRRGAFR